MCYGSFFVSSSCIFISFFVSGVAVFKGFGFVQYAEEESARKAVIGEHMTYMNGNKLGPNTVDCVDSNKCSAHFLCVFAIRSTFFSLSVLHLVTKAKRPCVLSVGLLRKRVILNWRSFSGFQGQVP